MHPPTQESPRDGLGQPDQASLFEAISQYFVYCENVQALPAAWLVATSEVNETLLMKGRSQLIHQDGAGEVLNNSLARPMRNVRGCSFAALTMVVNGPNLCHSHSHSHSRRLTYTRLPGTPPGKGRHLPSIASPRTRCASRAASIGPGNTPHLAIRITPCRNQRRSPVPGSRAAGGHAPEMLSVNR